MRKTIAILTILLLVIFMVGCENSVNPTISDAPNMSIAKADGETVSLAKGGCTTIQSGELLASNGDVITTGYDEYGYNYQGRIFKGRYCDSDRVTGGDYCDIKLIMKWNDAWLSNKDCDEDGLLDRHLGSPDYFGSGAWTTNHMFGEYYFSDLVDIGDVVSEVGHNLIGWGNVEEPTSGWGDHAGDLRVVWEPEGDKEASLTMTSNGKNKEIIIRHLDGQADDGFELFINGELIGTYDTKEGFSEDWFETAFSIPKKFSNSHSLVVKIVATGEAWDYQHIYGQLAVDYIELTTDKKCEWNWFVKIVAVPNDAVLADGIWYTADGIEIGPIEWGAFAMIQSVYNDPCGGFHGVEYLSDLRTGLGGW